MQPKLSAALKGQGHSIEKEVVLDGCYNHFGVDKVTKIIEANTLDRNRFVKPISICITCIWHLIFRVTRHVGNYTIQAFGKCEKLRLAGHRGWI